MIFYQCPICTFSFNESDKAWDEAIAHGACPKCDSPLIDFRTPLAVLDEAKKSRRNIRDSYLVESNYKDSFLKLWTLRVMGFIIGTSIGFTALIILLLLLNVLTDSSYSPRGPAWLIIPISFGFAIASYAPLLWLSIEKFLAKSILNYTKLTRLVLAAIILWISSVGIYVYLFKPYGYIINADRIHLLKVIIFPIAICCIGLFIYKKIIKVPATGQSEK